MSTNRCTTMKYMALVYKQIHGHEIHDIRLQADTRLWNTWHMSTNRYTAMKDMTYVCKQIHDHDIPSDGSSWRPTLPSKHKPLSRPAGARSTVFASARGQRGSPCTSSITGGQGREKQQQQNGLRGIDKMIPFRDAIWRKRGPWPVSYTHLRAHET